MEVSLAALVAATPKTPILVIQALGAQDRPKRGRRPPEAAIARADHAASPFRWLPRQSPEVHVGVTRDAGSARRACLPGFSWGRPWIRVVARIRASFTAAAVARCGSRAFRSSGCHASSAPTDAYSALERLLRDWAFGDGP